MIIVMQKTHKWQVPVDVLVVTVDSLSILLVSESKQT